MRVPRAVRRAGGITVTFAITASLLPAQVKPPPPPGTPTVTVAAGARYQGGGLRRFLLGDTYRDLWATPIKVPVLDLRTHAGGLRPTKAGSGNQTRSLRFENPEGSEFVFRLVDKDGLSLPEGFEGSIIETITRDQVSAHHPAGALVADPILKAAGIPHPTPMLAVMPDDTLLGKFREDFAGRLGMIEPYPNKPEKAAGFAGAVEIIDSDKLQKLLDLDSREQVNVRAYLAARLVDMLINDWDRHPGNWKWARMTPEGAWQPVPRDRDKVMIEYGGIAGVAGKMSAHLIRFHPKYPSIRAMTWNSIELDRRLLNGLEKPVYDSIALVLGRRLTDSVIEAAVRAMPVEYHGTAPGAAAKLKARRDSLPAQAERLYRSLSTVIDLHATDAADRATVTLVDNRRVDVEIRSGNATPYFRRRFKAGETQEIRLYLHGGDDQAVVRGDIAPAIPVRIIGGNGTNLLSDSSKTAGGHGAVRLYDAGTVTDIQYGPDSLFDRRPWPHLWGRIAPPGKDRGGKLSPVLGLSVNGDVGVILRGGVNKVRYGFRKYPLASRAALIGEYATGIPAWRVTALWDRRMEESSFHFTAVARMSEIEVINFFGFGNDTPAGLSEFHEVRQRQWLLHPALAYALGSRSDLFIGPVIQYSSTDSIPDRLISEVRPYGFGDFGQAGLRAGLYSDGRNRSRDPSRGLLFDLSATVYPALWDVSSAFGVIAANTGAYVTLPVPVHPVLALRAGAKKVFGDAPFHEAAYIGGRASVRRLDRERYAGDAALFGMAELQIPVARFAFVVPIDFGIFGYGDAGRVYVDGASPGGWHKAAGVGAWIGFLNPATAVSLEFGDQRGRSGLRIRTGLTF